MKKTLVVNFLSGPGARKSTMAGHVYAELKWLGVNCEMAREIAKDYVWAGTDNLLDNQMGVFGDQQKLMYNLNGKVDVIITDSPLLLSIVYDAQNDWAFRMVILNEFQKYDNLNFFVVRRAPFNPSGRLHDEEQSKTKDVEVKAILDYHKIEYTDIIGERANVSHIVSEVMRKLGKPYDDKTYNSYTAEEILNAGEEGEINYIDVQHLITVLRDRRNSISKI